MVCKYLHPRFSHFIEASIPVTQSPLEPPNEPNLSSRRPSTGGSSDRPTNPSRPLTFDEVVALAIAFLSLGSVLLWGLTRGGMGAFSDSLAGVDPALVSPEIAPDAGDRPIAFNFGTDEDDLVVAPDGVVRTRDGEIVRGSARRQLEERAAIRQEETSGRVVEGLGAGLAGGAIVGAAANPDPVAAEEVTPEEVIPETEPQAGVVPAPTQLSEEALAPSQEAVTFNDVPENYWAKPYIDELSSRGLISGYENGNFRPDQPVTRAEIARIVSNTFVLTADKADLEFSDVESDYWARESIGEVVKGGFMTGFPNDTFDPNAPVTRAQALTTMVTGLGIQPPTNIQAALARYADANAIPNWANEKVAAATSESLVVNYPDLQQLDPNEPTTRAELSAIIYQALVYQAGNEDAANINIEPIDSEFVVKP